MVQSPTIPGQFDMWQNADVPSWGVTIPCCSSNLVVQSTITPGEFDMWQNAHLVQMYTPWLIKSSGTAPYYTRSKRPMSSKFTMRCTPTQFRCTPTPLLIDLSATESYCTMSVWHVTACRCTKVRCKTHPTPPYSVGDEYYVTSWFYLLHRCVWNAKIQTGVLLFFSLYFLWRFTCIEHSFKYYSNWRTLLY